MSARWAGGAPHHRAAGEGLLRPHLAGPPQRTQGALRASIPGAQEGPAPESPEGKALKTGKVRKEWPKWAALISVRSVVDLQWPFGPSSVVSGRWRGLRLESTQAHLQIPPCLIFPVRRGGLVSGFRRHPRGVWAQREVGLPSPSVGSPKCFRTFRAFHRRPG